MLGIELPEFLVLLAGITHNTLAGVPFWKVCPKVPESRKHLLLVSRHRDPMGVPYRMGYGAGIKDRETELGWESSNP
jgi:hypothetical protein